MEKKKKNYFQMKVTNAEGEQVTLRLPERYRTYFDCAMLDKNNMDYDNNLDALVQFYEEYFNLDDADRELFQDIVACGLVSPCHLVDLRILAQSIDEYFVIRDVSKPAELAEFYSYLAKRFEPDSLTAQMPMEMYDEIGKDIIKREQGKFYKGNYYLKMSRKMRVR